MRILIFSCLSLIFATAALADLPLKVSAEYAVSALEYGPHRVASGLAIASGGGVTLIAWVGDTSILYFVRVNRSGELLDPIAKPVAPTAYRIEPAVAWNGSSFLIAWNSGGIRTAEVFPDGSATIQPGHLPLSVVVTTATPVRLAWNGERYLLVYRNPPYTTISMKAAILDSHGGLQRGEIPVFESHTNNFRGEPANYQAASNGRSFLVTLDAPVSGGVIRGIALNGSGEQMTPPFDIMKGSSGLTGFFGSTVASDGRSFLVASGSPSGLGATIVSEDLAVGNATPLATDHLEGTITGVDWSGQEYFATFVSGEGVFGVRISSSGQWLDTRSNPIRTAEVRPSRSVAAWTGDRHIVAWLAGGCVGCSPGELIHAYMKSVGPGGNPSHEPSESGILLSRSVRSQYTPAAAFNGETHLVVWTEDTLGNPVDFSGAREYLVRAGRVDRDGRRLGDPIEVGTAKPMTSLSQPFVAVASDGRNFLVIWRDRESLVGRRFSADGQSLDGGSFPIVSGATTPRLAADHAGFMVICEVNSALVSIRVASSGLVDRPRHIAGIGNCRFLTGLSVVWSGIHYLVSWADENVGGDPFFGCTVSPDRQLHGMLLNSDGQRVGGEILKILLLSSSSDSSVTVSVGWNGSEYLVLWLQNGRLLAYSVSPAGQLLTDPPGPYLIASPVDFLYRVIGGSGAFFVIWSERSGVFVKRVISGATADQGEPTVLGRFFTTVSDSGPQRLAVLYTRLAVEEPYLGTVRLFLRFVGVDSSRRRPVRR